VGSAQFHIDAAEHFAREAASEEVGKNPQTRRAYVLAALKAASSAARAELRIITGTDPMRAELPISDLDTFLSSLDQAPQARAEQRLLGFATRLAANAKVELEGDTFEKAAMGLLTVELANWGIRAVVETIRSAKSSLLDATDVMAGSVADAPA
jgi:hypothetical protein